MHNQNTCSDCVLRMSLCSAVAYIITYANNVNVETPVFALMCTEDLVSNLGFDLDQNINQN